MDELAAALGTIDGLRAYGYYADNVTPPSAVVDWPDEIDYDSTMQRGSDRVTLPVGVLVGRLDARSSRDRLSKYVAGDGPDSVKAAIEAHVTDAWYSARVMKATFGTTTVGGTDYLSAAFDIELLVPGRQS